MISKIIKIFGMTLAGIGLFASLPFVSYAQYYNYTPNYNQTYPYNYNMNTYIGNYYPLYVNTTDATNITSSSAILTGQINGNSLYSTYNLTAWFQYGTSTNLELSTVQIPSNSGYASFNTTVGGLYPNTVYYFRAVAQGAQGVVYGNTNSFRTGYANVINNFPYNNAYYSSSSLTAITQAATNISNSGADLNSLVLNSPLDANTFSWFEYGTDYSLGNATTLVPVGALPAVQHVNTMNGLLPGTTYYFRSVAQGSSVKNVGSILSFTTGGTRQAVVTVTPTITSTNTITRTTPPPSYVPPQNTDLNNPGQNTNPAVPSPLGASVFGSGTFLPANLIGWLLIAILVLAIVALTKHALKKSPEAKV